MRRTVLILIVLTGVSFAFHYAWEISHVGLYGGYEDLTSLPITLWATIGDVVYTLSAYVFISLLKGSWSWLEELERRDVAGAAILGFFIALSVEYKALAFGRWFYLDAMPVIPLVNVGASPVLQMTILLPVTFIVARVIYSRFS